MAYRWSTIRRHDGDPSPGLDLSRFIVLGFLIAALLGFLAGLGWLGFQFMRQQFGG